MNVLFFGTPEVSVPFLRALTETHTVRAVITQTDKPSDRGHQLHQPPAKKLALTRNIPVFQPEKFDEEIVNKLKELNADAGVVVSYGRLIPEKVFSLPKFGCFNVHFSLLPKYRGAAPIQWALINGEIETGVTTFWIEKTLDTGPILLQRTLPILPDDDSITLTEKLIPLGIEAMQETLSRIKAGDCAGKPQSGEPTFAPSLKKEQGKIDWSKPAKDIANLIRGTKLWPGAYTFAAGGKLKGKRLKILKADASQSCPGELCPIDVPAGQITCLIKSIGFSVRCGKDFLIIKEIQPENKSTMPAWDFLQSGHLSPGDKLA